MTLQQHQSLQAYNTFGIDAQAEYFIELNDEQILPEISALAQQKHVIGGGSNVLLTKPVKGLVIYNQLKGISLEKEDAAHVWLKVQSGEVWHELVMKAIANNWAGIENLALIPGSVGAAPIQNIGAYGVEVRETIESVIAWHWQEKAFITYGKDECKFAYRDSIFKHQLKDKIFISSVIFKLNKTPHFNIGYGAIAQELEQMKVKELSTKAIADAVIAIRSSKLPDPKKIGNAGSFFKNPTIAIEQFQQLQSSYPEIPSYPAGESKVKVPAGWLIEKAGWKGFRMHDCGVHDKQALVLVNYGNSFGNEIWELSERIVQDINQKFGIELEREVQVW